MVPWLQKHFGFMASTRCFEIKVDGWKTMQGTMPKMKMKKKISIVFSQYRKLLDVPDIKSGLCSVTLGNLVNYEDSKFFEGRFPFVSLIDMLKPVLLKLSVYLHISESQR